MSRYKRKGSQNPNVGKTVTFKRHNSAIEAKLDEIEERLQNLISDTYDEDVEEELWNS